jgi:hypothetical protein
MWVMRTLVPAFVALSVAAHGSLAQPQDDQPANPAEAPADAARAQVQPEAPTTEAPAQDQVAALLTKARASYHKGVTAEHVSFRETWPDGREAKSTVTFLYDNGIPAMSWPRRLRLELGRLTIVADDHELTAINTQDPTTYFKAQLPEGLTMAALRGVLPPIPLPQLEWALGDSEAAGDPLNAIPGAGPIKWGQQTTESRTHQFTFSGEAAGGPVHLTIDEPRGSLVGMSGPYGKKGPSGQARLEIEVTQIEGAAGAQSDQWLIDTTGRMAVGFIAELKGRPPEILAGDRLPDLSLMSLEMKAVPLQDLLTPASDGPMPNTRPQFGAIVLYRSMESAPPADAQAGAKAIAGLRGMMGTHFADASKRPRVLGLVVATLQLQEFTRTHLGDIDQEWAKDSAAPGRAYSFAGNDTLLRLANKSSAALVVVDADQKVLKAISLDGRAGEDAAIAQEAMDAIVSALGP